MKLGVRPDQVAVILLNEPWFLLFDAHVGPLAGAQVFDEKLRALLDKGIDLLDDCEIESSHSPVVFYEIKKVDCLDGQFARVQKSFFC